MKNFTCQEEKKIFQILKEKIQRKFRQNKKTKQVCKISLQKFQANFWKNFTPKNFVQLLPGFNLSYTCIN